MARPVLSGALVLLGMATALAQAPGAALAQAPQVVVDGAWSRATPPGASTGAVYLTLTSAAGDRLVGASSAAAKGAQLHEMAMDGTVMKMRELSGVDLPAGKPVAFKPGGNHIMLVGLTAPLKQGQTVQVHLTFAKAAPVDVSAPIAAVGASAPPGMGAMPGMRMP